MTRSRALIPRIASLAIALGAWGCGDPASSGGSASSDASSAAADASQTPAASGSVAASPAPPAEDPVGAGIGSSKPASDAALGCKPATFELATYLLRGELTLAGHAKGTAAEFAASWLVQLRGKAQIAFAGFDGRARRIARDRGIGNARERAPRLFATGDLWTVAWFDSDGLAYARPLWETLPEPEVQHLSVVKNVDPDNLSLAATPDGALVVASPFGTQGDQLSVFLFAPVVEGQRPKAIGVTRTAKKPRSPAVSADKDGYTVAWTEDGGGVHATRFDPSGKEVGDGAGVLAGPVPRTHLQVVAVDGGSLIVWLEGDRVLGRKLDANAHVASPIFVVAKGAKHPVLISAGAEAFVAFIAESAGVADQLLVARVTKAESPEAALRVSDGAGPVLDPPAMALAGGRLGLAWTETMGPAISSKRAWLRIIEASCAK